MCGYNSAREVGGVGCAGCPAGETESSAPTRIAPAPSRGRPPPLRWRRWRGTSPRPSRTAAAGCRSCFTRSATAAASTRVTADELSQFLDWLAPRAADGTTTATVSQVIGGGVKPAVAGPPITPPGAGIVPNPGFEADSDQNGVPDCWYLAGFGTNTYTWTRTTNAHTGGYAERLDITSWTSGDRKAITTSTTAPAHQPSPPAPPTTPTNGSHPPHQSASSPTPETPTAPGHSGPKAPFTPAATTWTQAHWTPPPIPTGTTALSIGLSLASTGTATFDDLDVAAAQNLVAEPEF